MTETAQVSCKEKHTAPEYRHFADMRPQAYRISSTLLRCYSMKMMVKETFNCERAL